MGKYTDMLGPDARPRVKIIAVDPEGCGCTECITGEYRPLDLLTDPEEKAALIRGEIRNHTDRNLYDLAVQFDVYDNLYER